MSDLDYNRILGAVQRTMSAEQLEFAFDNDEFTVLPVAANDNGGPWPHLPFPDGWTASC